MSGGLDMRGILTLFDEADKLKRAHAVRGANEAPAPTPAREPPAPAPAPAPALDDSESDEYADRLPAPEYSLFYSQAVAASEVYGGFSGMTPSAADAQRLVVAVSVGDTDPKRLNLDVTPNHLRLLMPGKRLSLRLPHRVIPSSVRATFDATTRKLRVEMRREELYHDHL